MSYVRGNRQGWVASNDDMTRFWRAEYLGGARFRLTGGPVSQDAFGDQRVLRLWEYGVGDSVWQRTSVAVRRVGSDRFELEADTAVDISLRGSSAKTSADGKTWQAVAGRVADGWLTFAVSLERVVQGPVLLEILR